MAEKPVIVPVNLEVTDVDLSKIDINQVNKDMSQRLSGLKKSIEDVFSSVDTSKMSKSMTSALSSLKKDIKEVSKAQARWNSEMEKAGTTSETFKKDSAELDRLQSKLTEVTEKMRLFENEDGTPLLNEMRNNIGQLKEYNRLQQERKSLEKQISDITAGTGKISPEQYVGIGDMSTEAAKSLVSVYERLATTIANVNKHAQEFNNIVDNNKVTDEYSQAQAKAEALKAKLEELNEKSKRMAATSGTTDNAWETLQYDVKQTSSELDSVLRSMRSMVSEGKALRFDAAKEDIQQLKAEIKSINQTRINIAGNGKNKTGTVEARTQQNMNPYTADYKKSLNELSKLEDKATKVVAKYNELRAAGNAKPEAFVKAQSDAEALIAKIEQVRIALTNMIKEGKAFRFGANGDAAAEISNVNSRAEETTSTLSKVQARSQGLGNTLNRIIKTSSQIGSAVGGGFKTVANACGKVISGLKKIVSGLGSIIKKAGQAVVSMNKFGKSGKSTTLDLSKGFKKLRKNVLMFGLGIRSTYYLIKKLRTYFITAFKTLATQSSEVNQQVSSLTMSFIQLKASLATAFQPLATVVVPLLNTFMDKVSQAMELVGKFFATLVGQKYIYKATANQYDYAKSLEDTADAADEVTEKLAAYDKLDVINDDKTKDTKTKDNGLLDVTYTKADAEGAVSDFAKMVKDAWNKADFTAVGKVIHDKMVGILDKVKKQLVPKIANFVNTLASSIITFFKGLNLKDIGKKVADVINELLRLLDAKKIGAALSAIYSAFWQFAYGLVNNINWKQVGEKIADFITGFIDNLDVNAIIGTVTGLINGLGQALLSFSTRIKWKEIGQKLGKSIVKLFTDIDWKTIIQAVSAFAKGLADLVNEVFSTQGLGESIGATIAGAFLTAINLVYNLVSNINFEQIGTAISNAVNTFLNMMAEVDPEGLSGWAKLGQSLFNIAHGILTMLITALTNVNWTDVGEAIGTFLSSIDWGQLVLDLSQLAWAILKAIADGLMGWMGKDPVSATLATILGAILLGSAVIKKVSTFASKITGFLNKIPKVGGKNSGGDAASATMEEASSTVDTANTGTSKLTGKLQSLVQNLALGIAIIAEVAIAAGLVVAAIWGLGLLLQQVVDAWQPIIENGQTAIISFGLGTAILVSVGVACAALGQVGTSLIVQIALGTAMLALIGAAAALFLAEIWAIGWGLDQIGQAWQTVLDNGETIATSIGLGTAILVGIGVVCALLGVAAVASCGLLPIAIALGTAMLIEVGVAAVLFIAEILVIGKALNRLDKAWKPVLAHGDTIAASIKLGTKLLIGIGAACALLGVAAVVSVGLLPIAIALGTSMLEQIGEAAILFIAEIVAVGKSLSKIGKAWKPVLKNGSTITKGISSGTNILIKIAEVCAVLGAITIGSFGLAYLAIDSGTDMLRNIKDSAIDFCNSLIAVAKRMTELATVLIKFNKVLPGFKRNMTNFEKYMENFVEAVGDYADSSSINDIGSVVSQIKDIFKGHPIKSLYSQVCSLYTDFNKLNTELQKINPVIKTATSRINKYKKLMGDFQGATSSSGGDGGIFGSMFNGAKAMVNGMIGLFEGLANAVIRSVNEISRALNSLSFDIPSYVPKVGGQRFSFNVGYLSGITIPRLAKGAVIPPNKEFLATLGDQKSGTNIEAPLETIKLALAEVLAQFGGGNNEPIVLQLDGKVIARVVWDENEKRYKQTGKSVVYG